jgi:uncharacterized protein
MKPLELNVEKIAKISEQKEDENYNFRSFLKVQDSKKTDQIVHQLNKVIEAQIDCTLCGNCCKSLRPGVTDSEIDCLSGIDNISREDFIANFIDQDDVENIKYLKDAPCKYLAGTKCSIYAQRPSDCSSYPHIHKDGFTSRTFIMIENYGICPIVFNVFENLKIELGFKG